MLPVGNGMYLWQLERCTGGNPAAMADLAVRSNLKWVAIKIANGILPFGKAALNQAAVSAFRDRGLQVWGWHYVYGHLPQKEAEVAARQVDELDVDGYVIDAEEEYKLPGKDVAAKTFMNTLRPLVKKPIGLTAYRYPSYHPEFPWNVFLPRVDFNSPQVYWIKAHNPGYQLHRSVSEFRKRMPNQPIIPLGAAFTEQSWNPTKTDILEFRKVAADLGLPGYGWWEWYHAETKNPMWWEAATQDTGVVFPEEPGGEPVPTQELVATEYPNLRVRSGPSTGAGVLGYMRPMKVYTIVERSGDWGRFSTGNLWVNTAFVYPVKRVTTRYSNLRIRKGPSLTAPVYGYLQKGVTYLIVGTSGPWGRIEGDEERWIHLHYTTEI